MNLQDRKGQNIPHPGDQKPSGNQPPQNADTSNGQPAFPVTTLDTAPTNGPRPDFTPQETLLRLRMRFPNLQIIPVPHATETRVLAANVAEDMDLPDSTVAVIFFATEAFWANFDGRAAVPAADGKGKSLLIPQNFPYMIYVQGKKQLSVLAEHDAKVQAYCYIDVPVRG